MPVPSQGTAACVTLALGGVTLNPSLRWEDREKWAPVAQQVTRTLGGNLVTFAQGISKGRPITLVGNEDQGWLDYDQVEDVQALAETVGGIYTLQVDTDFYQVQFRHEEAPAFEATPVVHRLNPTDDDYFTVRIKLETV